MRAAPRKRTGFRRGGSVKPKRPGGYPGGSRTPDRGRRGAGRGPLPLFCQWEARLSAEGMPDPDRVVIRTRGGPRLRRRRFTWDRGSGGRGYRPFARVGLLRGRGEVGDRLRVGVEFDLRKRRLRRHGRRTGRVPTELQPGARRRSAGTPRN